MIAPLALVLSIGAAAELTIVQAGQQFLRAEAASRAEKIVLDPSAAREDVVKALKIKVGDTVQFKNLDRVAHNVYGAGFDLLSQPPGAATKQKFDQPGKQTIRCAIHPKMKFDLEVAP